MSTIEQLEQRRLLATISGTVFYDLNGNGINDGDNGAFNNTQTVFLDQNNNGVVDAGEAHQSVDQFGHYDFINLAAGTYRVALIPDSGYLRSTSQASVPVAVADMQDASGPDFGVTQRASLGGTTFNDANVNGLPDTGEPGVAKTIVFLDANGNGKVDSATSTISSSDVPQIAPGISSVASDLTVSGLTGLITDVNVTINLTSPNDNDPDIFLESPQGLRVELVSPIDTANNASQSNFTKTTFDDQASQAIGAGSGPFSGSFQTSGSLRGLGLDLFNNLSPNGTWRLIVEDTAGDNTARLKNWAITLTTGDPITKTDFGGAYGFSVAPGTYRVGAGKKTFTISAPGGKKHEFAVTVNATDTRQDLNFGMEEVGSDNSTIQFSPAFDLSKGTSDSPFSVVTGDFNKDGKLDIAAANNGSNDVGIYLGKGTGNFLAPVFYHSGEVPRAMASGDFNHDGNIDLVIANHDDKNVGVLLGNGNGTFQTVRTFNTSNEEPWSVAVGDFNGDGKQDLAVAIQDMPPKIDIFLGKGNGNFLAPIPIAAANEPTSVQTADVNRDGKLDLIVTNNTDNKVSVFIGKGNGNFTLAHNI
ncbi:MAG TPA: FG-GAP-like repeat-containing protein, partial [Tepidisphaeraceae bacterium]|nr:FG-GAP-like repeat-containing protein [Tepidisphaeraceae bacterium]